MLMRSDSFLLQVIMFISSPTMYLPSLIPLRIESVRIGQDCETFVRVYFKPYR